MLLSKGADFAFSELIQADRLEKEKEKEKLKVMWGDESATIWQIGASNKEEMQKCIDFFIAPVDFWR